MFVRLTTVNNKDIYINTNYIESLGVITEETYPFRDDFIGYTYILTVGMDANVEPYIVKESPVQIVGMINNRG